METLGNRIKDAAENIGGLDALAVAVGVSRRSIYDYAKGTTEPKVSVLLRIAEAVQKSASELLGERSSGTNGEIATPTDGFSLVPRYAVRASAGAGLAALAEHEADRLAFRTEWLREMGLNPKACGLVTAAGDSMEPTIPDGSILLVDMTEGQKLRSGCFYIVVLDGDLLVKRLMRRLDGTIELISDNPIYPREVVPPGHIDRIRVPGRVVWFGRSI